MGSLTRSARNIAWIERFCRVPEGALVGQQVKLRPWQKKELVKIYDNPNGTRRAILSFGRKNGKTALSAFLCLLHLCGPEAKPNSQLYSAAQSRDQASILFSLAAKVVRMSAELNDVVTVKDSAKELFCEELGARYKALSADASTAYGLSPVFIVHDELGQVRGPRSELYEALETATGGQEDPISIVISTQAPTEADLLSVLIDDALEGEDPRVVVSLYAAPPEVDAFTEEAIKAANPAFGDFQNAKETLAMAADAKRMPSRQPEFENLILNRRVDMNSPFVSRAVWQACAGEVIESFQGYPVWGGLDLSEVADLTSLVLVAPIDGVWHVKPTFWLPGDNLETKARADRVPYDLWRDQGVLTPTPGPTVDYEYVAEHMASVLEALDVRQITFDRWNWRHFKPWLEKAGVPSEKLEGDDAAFKELGQGFQSMSPALRDLESVLLQGKMAHGAHPVLEMCARNATVKTDPAGNRKLDKSRSSGRIDGMVALAMAMSAAVDLNEVGASVYEERGLLLV